MAITPQNPLKSNRGKGTVTIIQALVNGIDLNPLYPRRLTKGQSIEFDRNIFKLRLPSGLRVRLNTYISSNSVDLSFHPVDSEEDIPQGVVKDKDGTVLHDPATTKQTPTDEEKNEDPDPKETKEEGEEESKEVTSEDEQVVVVDDEKEEDPDPLAKAFENTPFTSRSPIEVLEGSANPRVAEELEEKIAAEEAEKQTKAAIEKLTAIKGVSEDNAQKIWESDVSDQTIIGLPRITENHLPEIRAVLAEFGR